MRNKLDIEVYGIGARCLHRNREHPQPARLTMPVRLRRLLTWVSELKGKHPDMFEGGASREAEHLLRHDWEPKQ